MYNHLLLFLKEIGVSHMRQDLKYGLFLIQAARNASYQKKLFKLKVGKDSHLLDLGYRACPF